MLKKKWILAMAAFAVLMLILPAGHAARPTKSPPRKDTGTLTVECVGSLAHEFFVTVSPTVLWPPNHAVVPVTITLNATTDTEGNTINLTVNSIASSQGSASAGVGSSASATEGTPAVVVVHLTAERTGKDKNGNIYTIHVTCTEPAEAETGTATLTVVVPHDQGH